MGLMFIIMFTLKDATTYKVNHNTANHDQKYQNLYPKYVFRIHHVRAMHKTNVTITASPKMPKKTVKFTNMKKTHKKPIPC